MIYYISSGGNDSTGTGAVGAPWATISKAHTSASSGDTIMVVTGSYTWASQTFSKNLTIQAVTTGGPVFNAAAAAVNWVTSGAVTINITGLQFTNANNTANALFAIAAATATMTLTNCTIYSNVLYGHFTTSGIACGNASGATITFISCLMYNNTFGNQSTYNSLFANTAAIFILTNCTIYTTTTGANYLVYLFSASGTLPSAIIKNCILVNTGTTLGLTGGSSGGTRTFTYSDTYGTGLSVQSGTSNISADPLFVDAANNNFNLRPTSPCIDTGSL